MPVTVSIGVRVAAGDRIGLLGAPESVRRSSLPSTHSAVLVADGLRVVTVPRPMRV